MNSIGFGRRELLIFNNFQQVVYSFDTPVNSQEAQELHP